jgi:HK97 family phage prohead protease
MPWNIRDDHPDCSGFAVVKSDTGELVACHDTRAQAEKQLAALYANEPQARAVWTTAYVNNLPDGAFLYIAPGGSKDSEGKTVPRSLRFFPYKDASGAVDLAHLRNALARIPQSNLPAGVKQSVTAKAQRILQAQNENRSLVGVLDELALVINHRSLPFDVDGLTETDNVVRFEGHAAVYDEETEFDIPGVGTVHEVIDRGSFRKVLASKPQVPMLYNHDPNAILADTANGTLLLKEDKRGLLAQAEMERSDPDVQRVVAKIQSGLVRGMSFGFVAGRENQTIEHRQGGVLRRLSGFKKLLDVGPVVGPAYSGTDVALRSAMLQFALSSEQLQQVLLGAYPQLEDGAAGSEAGTSDEEARSDSGVAEPVTRTVAARRRAHEFIVLSTGGIDDEA